MYVSEGYGSPIPVITKPYDDLPRVAIDASHVLYLEALLGRISLVDAHGVNPDNPLKETVAQMAERRFQILCDLKECIVKSYLDRILQLSPNIRQGFVEVVLLARFEAIIEQSALDWCSLILTGD